MIRIDTTTNPQVPPGDEYPLDVLLDPLLAMDQVQCDAWKDEVQNLYFCACFPLTSMSKDLAHKFRKAGLFSAVIT